MGLIQPNGPFYNASSATINAANCVAMATNLVATSAMNATSATAYLMTLQQASSCILGLITQAQQGFQISS
jgi:hypothetical protein